MSNQQKIIVSLTSFPEAIPYAVQAIRSVLKGSYTPFNRLSVSLPVTYTSEFSRFFNAAVYARAFLKRVSPAISSAAICFAAASRVSRGVAWNLPLNLPKYLSMTR